MYNKLILIFLLFIIIFYFLNVRFKNKDKEYFTNNSVDTNKNMFIKMSPKYEIDNINVNKLCIKDGNEIECISKEELFNALELPKFRREAVCVDDACITNENTKLINGNENVRFESRLNNKCINKDTMEASPSIRKVWKWETGNKYDSKNEPDNGWERKRCGRKCNNCKNYNSKELYGCDAKRSFVKRRRDKKCIKSSGFKCKRKRDRKRKRIKLKRKHKRYTFEGDKLGDVPILNAKDCDDDETTEFKIEKGDRLEKINLYNKFIPFNMYKNMDTHSDHLNKVIG